MKGLIQRVSEASVVVDEQEIARIGGGILLFLGIEQGDEHSEARTLCRKMLSYRIFPDEAGRMNRSLLDTGGGLLVVPQFTLAADTSSGTRPGFSRAAAPTIAKQLYTAFLSLARAEMVGEKVAAGHFGADMKVSLVNDGPVTFMLSAQGQPES